MYTMWDCLRDAINNKVKYRPGKPPIIYRQEILIINEKQQLKSNTTIDKYRAALTKLGYLKTVRPGVYEILKTIPKDLSTGDLNRLAYNRIKHDRFLLLRF